MKRAAFMLSIFAFFLFISSLAFCLVNVNTASQSELEQALDISASDAKRIIDGRPYSSVDDLKQVSGISRDILDRIMSEITISTTGRTTDEIASERSERPVTGERRASRGEFRVERAETREERAARREERRDERGNSDSRERRGN